MIGEHFLRFFPAICAGLGLFLVGGANLLLVRRGVVARATATLIAVGVALAASAALDVPGATGATARLLACGLAPALALGNRRLTTRAAAALGALHRPAVRYGLLMVVGVGAAIGSVVVYERAEENAAEAGIAELELLLGQPETAPTERIKATTDCGTRVVLKEPVAARGGGELSTAEERILRYSQLADQVIRRSAADDRSNCHGWVFTGGRFLLGGEDVEVILRENDYREEAEPCAGDLVIYRGDGGAITHSALVRYVSAGQPVLVESKWGNLGVFLHPADKSPYGTQYTFHRTDRRNHLLTLTGPTSASGGDVQAAVE